MVTMWVVEWGQVEVENSRIPDKACGNCLYWDDESDEGLMPREMRSCGVSNSR